MRWKKYPKKDDPPRWYERKLPSRYRRNKPPSCLSHKYRHHRIEKWLAGLENCSSLPDCDWPLAEKPNENPPVS